MVDLTKLSRQALSAAMRGGTEAWGQVGSATEHVRYSEPLQPRTGRRRACCCGCGGRSTHRGAANGVALTLGCELSIARWVRTGSQRPTAAMPAPSPDAGPGSPPPPPPAQP